MELSISLLLLGLVINRIVEVFKRMLPAEGASATADRWREPIILALSFGMGGVFVIAIFPADNMFPGAISPFAGQLFTGVLVGGVANGWDFLGGLGEAFVRRTAQPQVTTKASMQMSASSVETPAPHDGAVGIASAKG